MTTSLKSFIKSVRSSKTIADERSIIRRESALIRTAFKDTTVSHNTRRVNIQKLLFLYILGEKTHFGQIECIKLLASPNFLDKRLGYLATMLILDENQEVLTLLTNSLNNDLNHPNQFIVSLALATTGNICSPELARDIYTDVEHILTGNNNYLKKKAALVASKIVEKDPDLSEIFQEKLDDLLRSQNHGVLLGTFKLIRSIYEVSPESRPFLISKVPTIINITKHLLSNFNPEYDTPSLHDPFLVNHIVRTLGVIFTDENQISNSSKYTEQLNDVLTNLASTTSYTKNAGASVLHEVVKTIFGIPNLDPALKVLGINTLGQLLSTKDNNNRYVALNTLLTVVNIEPLAVQRHRQTIVACLSDQDISIKRRALELSFAILDASNIRILIREILTFLEKPVNNDKELKSYIVTNVANILDRRELIPNEKWRFDTLVKLVELSDEALNTKIASQLLALVMNIPDGDELKSYTANKIFKAAYEDSNTDGLNLMCVYLVGEYGDLLIGTSLGDDKKITEGVLTDYLIDLSRLKDEDVVIVSYILTACIKLSIKTKDSTAKTKLKKYIESKTTSSDLNLQIKAVTYSVLFNEPDHIKRGVLGRMPAPVIKEKDNVALTTKKSKVLAQSTSASGTTTRSKNNTEDLLLDLMDDNDATPGNNGTSANSADLLGDIFGSSSSKPQKSSANTDILGLFDSPASNTTTTATSTPQGIQALSNSNVKISFRPKSMGNGQAVIETILENKTFSPLSNLQLLIAVPKTQKLTMSSISAHSIQPNSFVTQDLKIVGTAGAKIKLRVKFEYDDQSGRHTEQFDFGGLKDTL